ncbi:MAG: pseudouridine synthase [Anaerolineales bacterium]|nr:pseudouridine synthase [Anaerolineales bacterium]
MEERLQKILAQAGLGSRRACEELIVAGRITVNGQVAALGSKADAAQDRILLDGNPIRLPSEFTYIALYKPRNVLTTVSTPDRRTTVLDLVEHTANLFPVGRLDLDSEGLVLLTNDGELANRLTHPRYGHEKEYRVLVARHPDEEQLNAWRRGVVLPDGYHTAPARVWLESKSGKGAWLRVVLNEGRKHQIRHTGSALGLPVVKIVRVRTGTLHLGGLKPREWRCLTADEVAALKGEEEKARPKLNTARLKPTASRPKSAGEKSRPKKSGEPGRPPEKGRRR